MTYLPPQPQVTAHPPPYSLFDPLSGLFPHSTLAEVDKNEPSVFVIAGETADTTLYGMEHKVVSRGSGAGLTLAAAHYAAMGEGVERYAFSVCDPADLVLSSYHDLQTQGKMATAPGQWALFDLAQHAAGLRFPPFTADTLIAWAQAESLTYRRDCLVPASMVYIPYSGVFRKQGEQVITLAISTGAACAPNRAQALLSGICELIERDAVMIFWRNRLTLPRVQIDPKSPVYSIFQQRFQRHGLHYTIINTTLDLEIPSFMGIVLDTRSESPGIMVGGAAHPDPNRAVLKTLLELAQGLKWKDHMTETISPEPDYRNVRSFDDRAHLYATNDMREAFRFVWEHGEEIPLSEIASRDQGDTRQTLRWCVEMLAANNLETLALDLTTADAQACGLSVIRTMIPGLETMEGDHCLPFLGGKRWREVPIRLGLLSRETDLTTLNPYPHPYP
jgi:ribosomal protein S12 methylthiotransferase accessory factor